MKDKLFIGDEKHLNMIIEPLSDGKTICFTEYDGKKLVGRIGMTATMLTLLVHEHSAIVKKLSELYEEKHK